MTAFAFPRLTAAVLAGAVALTGISATPANAMNDRDRAALGLIVGLGVLAAIADGNDSRRDHRPPPQPPRPRGYPDHRRADDCRVEVWYDRHGRRIEEHSPGCNDRRGHRRDRRPPPQAWGPDDWRYYNR
ncbi:hypothetical protein H9N28_01040 [Rhodobacter capsulatus]|uniref:Uncharacterized protein n=1 Tax=Rhodobacter capsulatus TaxID=1061 RepID=A0A0Q0QI20_RHOCA|nr:hypothetical protein [Rhodobacter capsulatus]KQB11330.1 hypothetical protein AP073_08840 [Rhodobacter capsulatus]KQB14132.1 hypothetical protein AP071_15970 [Rhodobacter capsulatus]PZX22870.1 hypothetical protein LY44_02723 [Rhodobacter capsulatus]QNR63454.1 hypothetical protein H9N28_01040 [Rhodobacter capsulatus]WER09598.1 hypothetical protein PUH89_01065 [Rhodobacter capsulatus]